MQNNFSFNSPEKVTTNNTTLISDDKFISLINNLSELIKDYYYTSKNNINEIFDIIKEKEENNIKKLFTQIDKQKKNLNIFVEKAKDIFKKMRIHKNSKSSGLTNSINSNIKNMNNLNNVIKIYDDYNSVNKKKNKNIIELKITSKFRTEDDSNKIINNTYNAFNTNIYNKTEKKYSNINSNLENIKNLIQKLSSYENIISKVSLKYKDNFKQLQNDINYLLDKCIYDKGRNSLKNNSSFYNEINNISNNGYDMNNYSFNYNINKGLYADIPKKNLFNEFNNKKEYNDNNNNYIIISELRAKNDLYKNKIKDLEFQVEDLKSKNLKVYILGTGKYVINQYPLKGSKVLENSKVFLVTNMNDYKMEDLTNWSLSEVNTYANLLNINLITEGYGYVKTQSIDPNTLVNSDMTLTVKLEK